MLHKERDFEYDLMKLMKRNSGMGNVENKKEERCVEVKEKSVKCGNKSVRFDWSKITDMNSSVHS